MNLFATRNAKAALRGALETAGLGAAAVLVAWRVWGSCGFLGQIGRGMAAAWLASALSFFGLLAARSVSPKAFWWAWGFGMALRVAVLAVLMALNFSAPFVSSSALLLSYVFGLLCFLPVEFWRLRTVAA